MANEQKTKAIAVELPDDATLSAGANYEAPSIHKIDGADESKYHYFWAAKEENAREDGVSAQRRNGYEVCTAEKYDHPDCVLMRIPRELFEARRKAKIENFNEKRKAANTAVPARHEDGGESVMFDRHGQYGRNGKA